MTEINTLQAARIDAQSGATRNIPERSRHSPEYIRNCEAAYFACRFGFDGFAM